MHLPNILLGLAATVSAIDITLYGGSGCKNGIRIYYTNLNPNTCVWIDSGYLGSVHFTAIPKSWNISCRVYTGSKCSGTKYAGWSNGQTQVCWNSGARLMGAGYGFNTRKRGEDGEDGEDVEDEVVEVGSGSGNDCQKPEILELEDGVRYNLTSLDDDQLRQILGAGVESADIPSLFDEYII